jgi:hypothetical protein
MKHLLFSILIIILSLPVFGQYDFKDAFYINNSGDTIYGQIDYNTPSKNSKYFIYRLDSLSPVKKHLPKDVQVYSFINSKTFVSKNIIVSDSTRTLFFEYLVNGVVDLYFIHINGFDNFLITKNGERFELTNKEIYSQYKTSKRYSNQYIGVLQYLMQDAPSMHEKINQTKFTAVSLIELVQEYHRQTCSPNQVCTVYFRKGEKLNDVKWKWSFGVSLDYVSSKTLIGTGIQEFGISKHKNPFYRIIESNISSNSKSTYLSPGVQLNISRNTKSSLQIGLQYAKSTTSNLNVTSLITPISWQYDLARYTKVIPYIQMGISTNIYLNAEFNDLYMVYQKLEVDGPNPIYGPSITRLLGDDDLDKSVKLQYNFGAGIKTHIFKTHIIKLDFRLQGGSHTYTFGEGIELYTTTRVKFRNLLMGISVFL